MSETVTKEEALERVTYFINKPGVTDLPVFIQLLSWRDKLTSWLLKDTPEVSASRRTTNG